MKCDKVVLTKEKWITVCVFNALLIYLMSVLFNSFGIDILNTTIADVGLQNILPIYLIAGIVNSFIFYSRLGEKNEN